MLMKCLCMQISGKVTLTDECPAAFTTASAASGDCPSHDELVNR